MAVCGGSVQQEGRGYPGSKAGSAWLTYDELAAELKVSKRTLWRWVAIGKITPYRFNGYNVRFKQAEVEAELLSKRRRKR